MPKIKHACETGSSKGLAVIRVVALQPFLPGIIKTFNDDPVLPPPPARRYLLNINGEKKKTFEDWNYEKKGCFERKIVARSFIRHATKLYFSQSNHSSTLLIKSTYHLLSKKATCV